MEYKSLGNTFETMANDLNRNVPHIIIGKNKTNYPNPLPPIRPAFKPYINQPKKNIEDTYRKIVKYAMWIAISLVVGYVIYKLVFGGLF